jgi:magnesium transporter
VLAGIGGMSEFSMMTRDIPWPIAYGAFVFGMMAVGWGTFATLRLLDSRKARMNRETARAA